MYLETLPNPVENAYSGGDSIAVRRLQEFCSMTQSNFQRIQDEMVVLNTKYRETQSLNKQLVQLLNWIATTNPQILDEFQTTAAAFDKLVPREAGGGPYASPQA